MIFVDVYPVLWYTVNSGAIKFGGEEGMAEEKKKTTTKAKSKAKTKPKTKKCKHCKSDMPYAAKVCPTCGRRQGFGCLMWILIFIAILFVLGIVDAIIRGAILASIFSSIGNETKIEQNVKNESSGGNELTVGSSFEKNGLKITVNDANLGYQGYDNEYGFYDLPAGMRYVMVSFTFENEGNSDAYVSIYDFNCYADDTSCEQAYFSDGNDFANTNLSPGRNISFQTYYKVPDNATTIELEYETDFWTGEKAIIKLQ